MPTTPEQGSRQLRLIRSIGAADHVDSADLESVDWVAEGGPYQALDHRFRWRTNRPLLAEALRECFSSLTVSQRPRQTAGTPDTPEVVYSVALAGAVAGPGFVLADDRRVGVTNHIEYALRTTAWHVNQEAARLTSRRAVVLHAAGVAKNGAAVILAAPMESGKSTLAAALLRAGWDYLSDEAIAIDAESLDVTSYPRAITLDQGSWPLFPELKPLGALGHRKVSFAQWHVPPGRVRDDWRSDEVEVAAVVLPRFAPRESTRMHRVSAADALTTLGEQTFRFKEHPQRNLDVLVRVLTKTPAWRLRHSDLQEAVGALGSSV